MFTYRFCPISDLSRTEQNGYPAFVCRLKSPTINDMAISVWPPHLLSWPPKCASTEIRENAPEHNLLNSTSIFSAAPVMKNLSRFELRAGQA